MMPVQPLMETLRTYRRAHKYTPAHVDMPTFSLFLPSFPLMHKHTQHATAGSFVKREQCLSDKIKISHTRLA